MVAADGYGRRVERVQDGSRPYQARSSARRRSSSAVCLIMEFRGESDIPRVQSRQQIEPGGSAVLGTHRSPVSCRHVPSLSRGSDNARGRGTGPGPALSSDPSMDGCIGMDMFNEAPIT
ncbi:hypothetical protein Sgleb_74030 [Streptomyces glebosus]|uniref:Uncharacterized protein n=1 Tax=Streptomyces glebosus TaxID=249580 RepID=A0A640TAN9_9ACTN|nr:hypothetical protein Sgleb_74030 [Streptomyces glebosus]GHG62515.1 hypothetical protein GCM10010513_29240 [Streptomyces glebosus]